LHVDLNHIRGRKWKSIGNIRNLNGVSWDDHKVQAKKSDQHLIAKSSNTSQTLSDADIHAWIDSGSLVAA